MRNYETWIQNVNKELDRTHGVSLDDLPDCNYRDWFDDKLPAGEAARMAVNQTLGLDDDDGDEIEGFLD